MLSSVLKSKRARLVNIQIMRAFVRLRQLLNTHKELARKLEELEKKYDAQFKRVLFFLHQGKLVNLLIDGHQRYLLAFDGSGNPWHLLVR